MPGKTKEKERISTRKGKVAMAMDKVHKSFVEGWPKEVLRRLNWLGSREGFLKRAWEGRYFHLSYYLDSKREVSLPHLVNRLL